MRRARIAAGLLVLVVALTGCGVMPTTPGEVRAGDPVEESGVDDLALLPNDPIPGSTPEQIVQDFIQAGISPAGDWSIARKFLAPDADPWEPRAVVMVDERDREVRLNPETPEDHPEVTVTTRQIGSVDETGVYTEISSTERSALKYTLVERDGEWRIKQAPAGVLIERGMFSASVYDKYPVTFWDPTFTYLVPDLRWFPRAVAPSRIVQALIAGPNPALTPAVQNAFPSGARVKEGLAQIENSVASVALTEMQGATPEAIGRMKAQLIASMRVRDVHLSVDDTVSEVAPAQAVGTSVDTRPLVLTEDGFGRLNGGNISDVAGFKAPLSKLTPTSIELAVSLGMAAVKDAAGPVYRVTDQDPEPALLDDRAGLVEPSIDPEGDIWSAPVGMPGGLRVYDSRGEPLPLTQSLTGITSLQAMQVSRDGTRLAVAATRDRERLLGYVPIVRDADGRPTGLGDFTEEMRLDGTATDVAWLDDLTIGALVAGEEGVEFVDKVIGGVSEIIPAPEGALHLAGANTAVTARLLTADGHLYARRVSQWGSVIEDVSVLANQTATGGAKP